MWWNMEVQPTSFLMIINMILHLDDNILMWIDMLPSLIMILPFYFNSDVFLRDSEVFLMYLKCFVRCYSCVMPVSEMSAMCMMYSCMLYQ